MFTAEAKNLHCLTSLQRPSALHYIVGRPEAYKHGRESLIDRGCAEEVQPAWMTSQPG